MSHDDLTGEAHDYPAREGPPARTILICTHPHSGGSLLGEALHIAGGLGCPAAYFHRALRPSFEHRCGLSGIDALVGDIHRLRTDNGGVLAVKLHWQDLEEIAHEIDPIDFPEADRLPLDSPAQTCHDLWARVAHIFPRPAFIHLERRDRLRQAAATILSGKGRLPAHQPPYDREQIAAHIALADHAHQHWRQLFAAIGATPHHIAFEDLDRDYAATVAALLAHLGSKAPVPPPRMPDQSDTGTEALVLRFLRDNQAAALTQQ